MISTIGRSTKRLARISIALILLLTGFAALAPSVRAADTTRVTIHLHGCPDGFDGINADIYGFAQQCHTPLGGVNITIQFGNLAPTQQTDIDGNWVFTDIPVGPVTITEFPPVAGWLIRAFCSQFDASGPPSGYLDAPVGQGSGTWNLQSGQALDCEWYNFPVVQPTKTTVGLRLHGCPDGFDGINASIYDFAQYCHTPLGGVDFTVQYAGLAPSHQTDLDGTWTFTDVTTGPITVSEFPPVTGWLTRAFCSQFDASGPPSNYLEAPAGQGSASWTLLPGQALACEYYNFAATTPTTATVTIRAHGCPNGYDAGGASIYDLAATCHGVPQGVTFTLTAVNGPPRGGQTGQDGMISWQNIPSGKITIREVLPNGVTQLRIFCNQRKLTGGELGFTEVAAAADGTITDHLLAGYDEYDCDWNNASFFGAAVASPVASPVPTDTGNGGGTDSGNGGGTTSGDGGGTDSGSGGGTTSGDGGPPIIQPTDGANGPTTLTIAVFTCPAAYDVAAKDADLAAECPDAAAGVNVSSLGGVSGTLATKTTGDDGAVVFPNLTPGAHTITVGSAQPLASAFILGCASNLRDLSTSPFFPLAAIGPDGAIRIDVRQGEQLACTWYQVPAQP